MDFKLIHLISDNWLHAIGLTLFHSLWIGVLLSIITAVVILLTRKSSAALRYQLLTGCLCLFVLAIGITLYVEFNGSSTAEAATTLKNTNEIVLQPSQAQQLKQTPINISTQIDQLLKLWNNYAAQIVLVWFLIICAKSVHLLLGLNTIFYLKRNKIFEAGKFWEHKLVELADKLQIRQQVRIVQSGIAQVPMVAGHFKPLILIPLGLLNGLSMAEVEAIICHELAHIKRRDYLVNLLQSFIEIIFFFNPAVLWLSKLIRTERENCCDDIALSCVADKKSYVKALISCQEFQMNTPEYAMALTGKKNDLLNRVSRMLFNTKSTLNKMEKTVLTLAMVFIFLFSATFSNAENTQNAPVKKQALSQDTTKKKLKKIAPAQSKTTSKTITVFKGNLSAKEQAEMDEAEAKFVAAQKEYEANEQKYKSDEKEYAKNEAKYALAEKEYLKNQLKYRADEAKYAKDEVVYQQNEQRYQAAQDQYKRDAKRYSQDSLRYEKYKKEVYPQTPTSPAPLKPGMTTPAPIQSMVSPITPMPPAKLKSSPVAIASPIAVPVNVNINSNVPLATPVTPLKTTTKTATSSRKSISLTDIEGVDSDELSDRVNNELLKDGIINQTKQLSYRLDKDGLYVNGKKQSEEMHNKYKAKYLKATSSALLYNYEIDNHK